MFFRNSDCSWEEASQELEQINLQLDRTPHDPQLYLRKIKYTCIQFWNSSSRLVDHATEEDLLHRLALLFSCAPVSLPLNQEYLYIYATTLYRRREYAAVTTLLEKCEIGKLLDQLDRNAPSAHANQLLQILLLSYSRTDCFSSLRQLLNDLRACGADWFTEEEAQIILFREPSALKRSFLNWNYLDPKPLGKFLFGLSRETEVLDAFRTEMLLLNLQLECLMMICHLYDLKEQLDLLEGTHGPSFITALYRLWMEHGCGYPQWDGQIVCNESLPAQLPGSVDDIYLYGIIMSLCHSEYFPEYRNLLIQAMRDRTLQVFLARENLRHALTLDQLYDPDCTDPDKATFLSHMSTLRMACLLFCETKTYVFLPLVFSTIAEYYRFLPQTEGLRLLCRKFSAREALMDSHIPDDLRLESLMLYAKILGKQERYGLARRCLITAEQWIETCSSESLIHDFYSTRAACHTELSEYAEALECWRRLSAHPAVSHSVRQDVLLHMDSYRCAMIENQPIMVYRNPNALHSQHTFRIPECNGEPEIVISYSGIHDLYDNLLNRWHAYHRNRDKLLDRELGRAYFQRISTIHDQLIRAALCIGAPELAVQHLEEYKSFDLSHRMQFLLHCARTANRGSTDIRPLLAAYRQTLSRYQAGDSTALFSALPDLPSSIAVAPRISTSANTGQRTAVLEFYYNDDGGICLVVDECRGRVLETLALEELSSQTVDTLIHRLEDVQPYSFIIDILDDLGNDGLGIDALRVAAFEEVLSELDRILLDPLNAALERYEFDSLVIIPFRGLHGLPLNLLGHSRGWKACLAARYALSFSPSLSVYRNLISFPVGQLRRGVVVAYSPSDRGHLAWAQPEGEAVSRLLNSSQIETCCLFREDAAYENVVRAISSADLIHAACHGIYCSDEPSRSGLLLGPEEAPEARLTVSDLWDRVDIRSCCFANLSACHSAATEYTGTSIAADDFVGLVNGFLSAGARTVLAGTSVLNDTVCFVFNVLFYSQLTDHCYRFADAFRAAISQLRAMTEEEILSVLSSTGAISEDTVQILALLQQLPGSKGHPFSHPLLWSGLRLYGRGIL